jgi:hypothetical protein
MFDADQASRRHQLLERFRPLVPAEHRGGRGG